MVIPARKPSRQVERKQKLRLWLQLLKTAKQIEAEVRERFRQEFDTTLPRFDVMSALDRNPDGLKMSELSRALRVSNGNVTVIVDRLVEDGMVVRVTIDGDRRASRIRFSRKGQKAFAEMAQRHEIWIDEMISDLGGGEAEMLRISVRKLLREEGNIA